MRRGGRTGERPAGGRSRAAWAPAVLVLLGLLASACTGAEEAGLGPRAAPTDVAAPSVPSTALTPEGTASTPVPADAPPGVVRVQGCEPRSLLPGDASRRCGQQVLTGLFSQLVALDPVDSTPRWGQDAATAVAASIDSIDARRWEVTLKEEWTFHDGSPVTAQSFVDAWNFAAYGPNGQANAFLFESIVGFSDLHCPDPGCEPVDTTLDGLRAIDDMTLELVLDAPDRSLPRRLGHVAFSPLPTAAFDDLEGYREAPVGNGPFRMEGAWSFGEGISLRAVADHPAGEPSAEGIDIVLFDELDEAWQALQDGRLDLLTAVPPDQQAAARGRLARVVRDGDDYEALVVPSHLPLSDDPRLARALSMAIDRRRLIDNHLGGAARPARGLVPAVVSNEVDRCRATCRFDPEAARALLAQVDLPPEGIELWFDRAGGQERWVRGIAAQLRQHLGLGPEKVRVRSLSHTSWVSHLQDQRIRGLYPIGWSMDVASPGEYLWELHAPGGLFNFDRYLGADVAQRLAEAAVADTDRETRLIHRRVEHDVLADMHHIPLWTRTHQVHHTPRVTGVVLDGKGYLLLDALAVADDAA